MLYFYVEPEVAGGFGERAVLDTSVHPPIVKRLHYQFDGWLGDVLVETFPVFLATEEAKEALLATGVTGVNFDKAEVSTSDQFRELHPDRKLPSFVWLKPKGQAGQDDIGTAPDGRLVVSRRALDALDRLGISNALIAPFGK